MLKNPSEFFFAAILLIFAIPYIVWKLFKTENYAPIFVVQIVCGIVLGPAIFGSIFPQAYQYIFNQENVNVLNGVAWLGIIFFVWVAGIHLDVKKAIASKKDSLTTSFLVLSFPLLFGAIFAYTISNNSSWIGSSAAPWQFILGIGMGLAVTALPILILLMEKLEIFNLNLGRRILRYASLDDILIWIVLSIIIMDWDRSLRQLLFIPVFITLAYGLNLVASRLKNKNEIWPISLIWVVSISLSADWAGLHYIVGAFLAGAAMKAEWFNEKDLDKFQKNVLILLMPVFFLITGLKTSWSVAGISVIFLGMALFAVQFSGKVFGSFVSGKLLGWQPREWITIGTLLQTKGLIEIIFASILLEKQIISSDMFTALLIMAILSTISTMPAMQVLSKRKVVSLLSEQK